MSEHRLERCRRAYAECQHFWYERFISKEEGGPGYRTECIRCDSHQDGSVMNINETIAYQSR